MTRGAFTTKQRELLLQPISDWRVQELDGISHLAAWDVVAHLNRMFGFEGWDKHVLAIEPVYEHVGTREIGHTRDCNRQPGCGCRNARTVPACSVGYRCTLRLSIYDQNGDTIRVIEDVAMGTATNQRDMGDAHDLALKSAVSYALKRCAKDLGDQFGLALYNKGQRAACVGKVAIYEGHDDVASHEGHVHADGIAEGDDGFGANRGDGEPAVTPDPVPADGEGVGGTAPEQPSEQPPAAEEKPAVREPEPARPKREKPEATPPEQKTAQPVPMTDEAAAEWLDKIASSNSVPAVKEVWKAIQRLGHLDMLVLDPAEEGKSITLRELMVRRVDELGEAA